MISKKLWNSSGDSAAKSARYLNFRIIMIILYLGLGCLPHVTISIIKVTVICHDHE